MNATEGAAVHFATATECKRAVVRSADGTKAELVVFGAPVLHGDADTGVEYNSVGKEGTWHDGAEDDKACAAVAKRAEKAAGDGDGSVLLVEGDPDSAVDPEEAPGTNPATNVTSAPKGK